MRLDVALDEHRRAVGVEPGRKEHRGAGERRLAELLGLERRRDRVQVDDAEERLALILGGAVLAVAAGVVAEGLVARGSDAGEDAHFGRPRVEEKPVTTLIAVAIASSTWSPSSWRELSALQQPEWPDAAAASAAVERLKQSPP